MTRGATGATSAQTEALPAQADAMQAGLPVALGGKVALVTGSSSGIGRAIAMALARHGATVAISSASSVADGERVAAELPGAAYFQADIGDPAEAAALVTATVERLGRLDILVNNAGTTTVIAHQDLDAVTDDVWQKVLRVNVIGTWHVIQAAAPHLRATGDGVIITVTSLAGIRPVGSSIPYAVSKAALNHLTVLLANVLGPQIRVHAVAPGLIDTRWTQDWDRLRELVSETAPLRRSGQPEDVADACLGLVAARYCTGQVLLVDGGVGLR